MAALPPVTIILPPPASFSPATNIAVGTNPLTVAIRDLNGDGKPDLAVANANSNSVCILLGTGDGSFGPATNFAVGGQAFSVAIGDLNGDGISDLAVANATSNSVSILLGTGDGSFGPATNFAVGSYAYSVAIGDLNGDGKPDLAVANYSSNNVSILLGTGTGSFGLATNFAVGSSPLSVAIGDLNGDGKPDLAVANIDSNTVSILLGTGTGSFGTVTNFAVGDHPYQVAIGDLNGDGKPDLAVVNALSINVSILLGTGGGSFGAATNFAEGGVYPTSVAIGDLNGDGNPDLAMADLRSNNVSILLGSGTGSFGLASNFTAGSGPYSVAIGDLNGDGKPDVAVANFFSNSVSILLNTTEKVLNTSPVISVLFPSTAEATSFAGGAVTLDASGTADPDGPLSYSWTLNGDVIGTSAILNGTLPLGDNVITLTVTDSAGASSVQTFTVTIVDTTPPVLTVPEPIVVEQDNQAGTQVTFVVSALDTGDAAPLLTVYPPSGTVFPLGTTTVSATATDESGNVASAEFTVTVKDTTPPILGPIAAPTAPIRISTPSSASVNFGDQSGPHTAVWDWEDGSTSVGTLTETNGTGTVTGDHTYTTAGVYTVSVTVTDPSGNPGSASFEFVVVYDPSAGFVTGGGWIDSPAGAYAPNPSLTGKANFGFVSKYQKGATVPTGKTEFNFKVADLNFHGSLYEWLVISGARAQYKGSGTINGLGDYGFLLTAIDGQVSGGGDVDRFRIKIWDKIGAAVVYDNKMGASEDSDATTELQGGSIVIQKK